MEELNNIFEKKEVLNIKRLQERLKALHAASNFKCETEEHRKARMALFFNLDNYDRAVKVAEDMLEKPGKEIKIYNQEKLEIAKRCGGIEMQQSNGQPMITEVTNKEKFSAEVARLDEKYKEALKEDYERQGRNADLTRQEITNYPEPHYADPTWFPDSITADKLAGISFMLKDMSEEHITE